MGVRFAIKGVLLCSPDWPWILYVDQAGLKLRKICLPVIWNKKVSWICISITGRDDRHFFRHFLEIFIYSFENTQVISTSCFQFGHFLSWHLLFWVYFFGVLNIYPLSNIFLTKFLSFFVGFFFTQLTVSLAVQNHFSFARFHLSTVGLHFLTNGTLFWESSDREASFMKSQKYSWMNKTSKMMAANGFQTQMGNSHRVPTLATGSQCNYSK